MTDYLENPCVIISVLMEPGEEGLESNDVDYSFLCQRLEAGYKIAFVNSLVIPRGNLAYLVYTLLLPEIHDETKVGPVP